MNIASKIRLKKLAAFFAIAFIYFFYCYNFMIGTFIKPTMITPLDKGGLGFTLVQTEQIFSCMSVGMIIGTILFGKLATRYGKKKVYICVALMISFMTFLPLFHPSSFLLWFLARTLTGIALGGVYGICMPLVTDLFSPKHSGRISAIITALFSVAIIFGGKLYSIVGDAHWRLLIMTAVIPPILGVLLIFFLVPDDSIAMKQLHFANPGSGNEITYRNMYRGKYLWIGIGAILLSGLNFVAQESYSNNITTYLITELGFTSTLAGSIYGVQGFGQFFGYLFWGTIADKFGQKIPAFMMFACSGLIFIFTRLTASTPQAFFVISILLGFGVGYTGSWGAYYASLFPVKFRSLSVGTSFNGGRIISAFVLPMVTSLAGGSNGMLPIFYVSLITFIAGSIVWALLPETNQKK